jgi:hypothetical protein
MNTELPPMYAWQDVPWRRVEGAIFKLQKRIYVRHESRIPAYENAATEEHSSRESLFPVPASKGLVTPPTPRVSNEIGGMQGTKA